jgi:predicted nuclease of predicted toxin-antitoxin system
MASFLIDASMPRPTAVLIASYGHAATDVRDIGMGAGSDQQLAAHAQANRLSLISRDQDFANVLDYPPDQYQGIVVIQTPRHASRAVTLALVEQLLRQKDVIDQLPGRLVIVEPGRIRCRPPI